jgi:hypothetical protein
MSLNLIKRSIKHWVQRRLRGWDDSDTWDMSLATSKLLVPRLIRFKQLNNGIPHDLTEAKWNKILDEMIWTFQFLASDEQYACFDKKKWARVERGLDLFREHFRDLWW